MANDSIDIGRPDRLELIEQTVDLTGEVEFTPEQMAELISRLNAAMARAGEVKAKLWGKLEQWLPRHGGSLLVGKQKFYIAPDKDEKCRSVLKTLEAIQCLTLGDNDQLAAVLSKNAFKPGACRKVLGASYDEFFETVVGTKMKVQTVDTEFLPPVSPAGSK